MNALNSNLDRLTDKNDKIAYLRAKSINALSMKATELYQQNFEKIVNGQLNRPLFDLIHESGYKALKEITTYSIENIYNHRSVVEIENAGYNVMYELLNHFIPPIVKDSTTRSKSEEKAVRLIPHQFLYDQDNIYKRVLGVVDYVSGMTDNYATELYKRIKGIEIGMKM